MTSNDSAWLAAAAAGALVFLFVWEQVQATRLGFELEGAHRAVQEARARGAYLRLELERRTAPAELAAQAHSRLGMLPPTPEAVVVLAQAVSRPSVAATAEQAAPLAISKAFPAVAPPAGMRPAIGAELLSWLLPSDAPRWR